MARDPKLAALQRRIGRLPAVARKIIAKGLDEAASDIVETAKKFAPIDDGALQASIRSRHGKHELSRVIEAGGEATEREVRKGADVTYDYAVAQELGTADAPAQPFFYPAWRLGKKRARGKVRRAVTKAAKDTLKGL